MQQDAVDCASQAMEKFNIEKDIAAYIKKGAIPERRRARRAAAQPLTLSPCPPSPLPDGARAEFDKKYGPTWHAVVGRNFGSYVTHETKNFIYFYLGQVAVLLFKSG